MEITRLLMLCPRGLSIAAISVLAKPLCKGGRPAASLIITTQNHATYLELLLASLERQFLPMDTWEVIIMDAASQDGTASVINACEQRKRLRIIRLQYTKRDRQATLLNEALSRARGHILIFLSDDRLVGQDFLLQHLLLQIKEECIVLGDDHRCIYTHLFAPDEPAQSGIAPASLLSAQDLDDSKQLEALAFPGSPNYNPLFAYFDQKRQSAPHPWACFTTANASIPREAIERIGGFDEYFSGWGLEETDLAYRLHQAGLPFRYAPKAITLRQLRPGRGGPQCNLVRDLNHFFCKYPDLDPIERELIQRGRYAPSE